MRTTSGTRPASLGRPRSVGLTQAPAPLTVIGLGQYQTACGPGRLSRVRLARQRSASAPKHGAPAMQLTWLGHSAFHLDTGTQSILIDPFWTGNPTFPAGYEDRLAQVDVIVLTHGHEDHLGDTVRLAKKYGATVVAQYEICMFVGGQGVAERGADEHRRLDRARGRALHDGAGLPQLGPDPGRQAGDHGRSGWVRDPGRRHLDLPHRRHGAVLRHGADPAALPAEGRPGRASATASPWGRRRRRSPATSSSTSS